MLSKIKKDLKAYKYIYMSCDIIIYFLIIKYYDNVSLKITEVKGKSTGSKKQYIYIMMFVIFKVLFQHTQYTYFTNIHICVTHI